MSEIVFELNAVHYSYLGKFPALYNVDLQVKRGAKIAIIGANGTGKSTLLQLLDGLLFPDQGSIKAWGRELCAVAFDDDKFSLEFRKRVGFVFQNPEVQLFCSSVREDIEFGPLQLGFSRAQVTRNRDKVVEELNLSELLYRAPHQLSIGEKRRVAIACVLAIEPEVIILDEPTAGLDPLTARHIIDIILQANRDNKTVITSTHDLHILEEISDMVYVFNKDKTIDRHAVVEEIMKDREFLHKHNLVHIHRHTHDGSAHTHQHKHPGQ